jgi:hypothetical protein
MINKKNREYHMSFNDDGMLPNLSKEPIREVDSTPDEEYPLRILRAHRANCDCKWEAHAALTDGENDLVALMNEHGDQRAEILDKAITMLENGNKDKQEVVIKKKDGEAVEVFDYVYSFLFYSQTFFEEQSLTTIRALTSLVTILCKKGILEISDLEELFSYADNAMHTDLGRIEPDTSGQTWKEKAERMFLAGG